MIRAAEFGQHLRDRLATVEERNAAALSKAADLVLHTIEADGMVHVAGTGHNAALCLESFYRAGGLANVYPVRHPAFNPLDGARASTAFERLPGIAANLVAQGRPGPDDVAFVYSNSGVNPVPVEAAQAFQAAGTPVVAVLSREHMGQVPAKIGVKLDEVADLVLDTGAPYGDACFEAGDVRVAGVSSLASIFLWDVLLATVAERATAAGLAVPAWRSANALDGDGRNAALLERYAGRVPVL